MQPAVSAASHYDCLLSAGTFRVLRNNIQTCICIYNTVSIYIYSSIHLAMHSINIYRYIHLFIFMYVCIYLYMYIHMYIYMFILDLYVSTYIFLHVYVYSCIYVHTHVYASMHFMRSTSATHTNKSRHRYIICVLPHI